MRVLSVLGRDLSEQSSLTTGIDRDYILSCLIKVEKGGQIHSGGRSLVDQPVRLQYLCDGGGVSGKEVITILFSQTTFHGVPGEIK